MRYTIAMSAMLIGMLFLTHCGDGDNGETEGEKVCKKVEAKLAGCKLTFPPGTQCKADSKEDLAADNNYPPQDKKIKGEWHNKEVHNNIGQQKDGDEFLCTYFDLVRL